MRGQPGPGAMLQLHTYRARRCKNPSSSWDRLAVIRSRRACSGWLGTDLSASCLTCV